MLVLLHNFKNIFLVSDLRKKLLFTFGVLAVYRFGIHVPIPGINTVALSDFMNSAFAGGFMRYFDMFSGGAMKQLAIFALGMGPYISASIMMQLLTIMVPSFEQLAKEGEYGRRIINQYTRYLTIVVALLQSFGMAQYIEHYQEGLVLNPGWGFRLTAMLTITVGSLLVMWFGEQITQRGLGQGSSMIIFANIVAGLPGALIKITDSITTQQMDPLMAIFIGSLALAVIATIVFLEKGERRIPVQYAKRVVGQKVYGGVSTYIPFKLNSANVVPVIFASTILGVPIMALNFLPATWGFSHTLAEWLAYGSALYNVLMAGLIIFFTFVYTAIIFNPVELADNIRKSGGFIPGIRPGRKTAEFFDYVLTRVGLPGAIYLALLAILPRLVQQAVSAPSWTFFDGTSLLIAVGVALDTSAQIESTLIERRYEGFLSSGRLKGRYGR